MRTSFVVLASLTLAYPAYAAYSPSPEVQPDTKPVLQTASLCEVVQTGFADLKDHLVARQSNTFMATALKSTTSPSQLVLALGLLQKPPALKTGQPTELLISLSYSFLQGVASMDDQAGNALVLMLLEAKGVCAQS